MPSVDPNINRFVDVYSSKPKPSDRFMYLDGLRQTHLERWRECSSLTVPSCVPPSGYNSTQALVVPEQSHGGRLVNNMTNQLMLTLFPAGLGFMKLDFSDKDLKAMAKGSMLEDGTSMYEAMRAEFVNLEAECLQTFESSGYRMKAKMIILQLIVAGNALYITDADNDRVYLMKLEDWVCVRNNAGELLEVVYREQIDDTIQYVRCYHNSPDDIGRRWLITRSDDQGNILEGPVVVLEDEFPVHAPTWSLGIGEDYGRGEVEDNIGDLRTYETGTRIINQTASGMSKLIITVLPNGQTKLQDVTDAKNCEVISGRAEDIGVVQANKQYDLSTFIQHIDGIKRSLDMSFMMADVIRRNAERVTAEEIQIMARELEKSKSGVYSSLTNTIQMPLARMTLTKTINSSQLLMANNMLSQVKPVIITGLQGLGRSFELENTLMFLRDVSAFPQMIGLIRFDQLMKRLANLRGIELIGMIKTNEELAAEQQQAALDQAAIGAAPEIAKGALR